MREQVTVWLRPHGSHLEGFLEVAVVVDDLRGSGLSFVSGGPLQRGWRGWLP